MSALPIAEELRDAICQALMESMGPSRNAACAARAVMGAQAIMEIPLIAAAPELLEALRTVDRIVLEQRCERGTPWDLACVTIAEKVREHVAPALSKATGQATLTNRGVG